MKGGVEDLELLIDLGANLHDVDDDGDGIMRYCVLGSNPAVFDFLAARMPTDWIHEIDSGGRMPLHRVFEFPGAHAATIAERLIRAGADVHARDVHGLSVAEIARFSDRLFNASGTLAPASQQHLGEFVRALRSCGYEAEADGNSDIFWLANEEEA